jgi:hypothetical protein
MSSLNDGAHQVGDEPTRPALVGPLAKLFQENYGSPQPKTPPTRRRAFQSTNPLAARPQPQPKRLRAVARVPAKQGEPARNLRSKPARPKSVNPPIVGEVIAARKAKTTRQFATSFLHLAGMKRELEHLLELEERLTKRTVPAMFHAALSTRLLLQGVADHCFPARQERLADRYGRMHEVGQGNVGNRLAAYVDRRFGKSISDEEHRLFIATLDTVVRWGARGPHHIYDDAEADQFFLRLLDVLDIVGKAYFGHPVKQSGQIGHSQT